MKKLLLEKPLNKITINDITEDCGVNRMTFYYHFKDIYDLVDWILAEDAAKAMEGRRGFGTWSEAYLDVLHQLQDNKTLVLNVYRSVGREQVEQYLYRLLDTILKDFADRECHDITVQDADKQFVVDFYKYALVGMTLEWTRRDMKADPAVMVAYERRPQEDGGAREHHDPRGFPPCTVPPEQRQLENRGMMCFVAVRLQ